MRPCSYKTASGRGRWLSRDPLAELAFFQQTSANVTFDQLANQFDVTDFDGLSENNKIPSATSAYYNSSGQIYVFCSDNPVNSFDPTGQQGEIVLEEGSDLTFEILQSIEVEAPKIYQETSVEAGKVVTWFQYNGQRFSTWLSAAGTRGTQIHQAFYAQFSAPWETEVTAGAGRADVVLQNVVPRIIIELKPNNAAAILKGTDQLLRYSEALRCYNLQLQPYNLIELPGQFTPVIK